MPAGQTAYETDGQLLDRFLHTSGEAPFAQLMQRHGAMVHGVCRRMLAQTHDADDAVQAVFLMLAQKAPKLGRRASLAGWLHEAAVYVAMHARRAAAVREKHEREAAVMAQQNQPSGDAWESLRPQVDAEIKALPEKYRLPIILHHFEGCSHEEGAALLGCSIGTFSGRLSRAREMLRQRLNRQDKTGAAPATASALAGPLISASTLGGHLSHASPAALSSQFITTTAKAAAGLVGGNTSVSAVASAQVASLVHGGLHALYAPKLAALAAGVILGIGLTTATVAITVSLARSTPPAIAPSLAPSTPLVRVGRSRPVANPAITDNADARINISVKVPADQRGGEDEKR